MKSGVLFLTGLAALIMVFAQPASAALTNRFVVKGHIYAAEPYDDWTNAAADIQTAIDYAQPGETVLVSNGVYDTGGVTNFPVGTFATNRVAIYKKITVRSANNDPVHTIIKGAWDANTLNIGPSAVRCVYMTNDAILIGFTLTNGATLSTNESLLSYNLRGGGVCSDKAAILSNCTISGNFSCYNGGGVSIYNGKLYDCIVVGNQAINGGSQSQAGGVNQCTLYRCTVAFNSAMYGGGVNSCTMFNCPLMGNQTYGGGYGGAAAFTAMDNCTVVGNKASGNGGGARGGNVNNSVMYFNSPDNWNNTTTTFTNSCTWPTQNTWTAASGNTTNDPLFIANGESYGADLIPGNYRLRAESPCMNAGFNFTWHTNAADVRSVDLDGLKRVYYSIVDMGAYERLNKGAIMSLR